MINLINIWYHHRSRLTFDRYLAECLQEYARTLMTITLIVLPVHGNRCLLKINN